MNRIMKRVIGLTLGVIVAGVGVAALTGCQTVKGVGQDIKNAGEAGERAIDGK